MFWEQMSIAREFGHTIEAAHDLTERIKARGIPLHILIDVDHGDVSSLNSDDTDPYAWIRAFGRDCRILHVKQSSSDKGGHWPFVEPYNSQGRIRPQEIVSVLDQHGRADVEICLELAFREREPADRQAVTLLRESVAYWAAFVDIEPVH